jgi:hypothetical protein
VIVGAVTVTLAAPVALSVPPITTLPSAPFDCSVSGLVKALVLAAVVSAAVPPTRPIVIPLKPVCSAVIDASGICIVPAPPASPMLIPFAFGCTFSAAPLLHTEAGPPLKFRLPFSVMFIAPNPSPEAPTEELNDTFAAPVPIVSGFPAVDTLTAPVNATAPDVDAIVFAPALCNAVGLFRLMFPLVVVSTVPAP